MNTARMTLLCTLSALTALPLVGCDPTSKEDVTIAPGYVYACLGRDGDEDGTIWTLGYNVTDSDGEAITPPLDVTPGQSVELFFASLQDFGVISGFVLRDTDGVLAALEGGSWGSALDPDGDADPIDEFEVSVGEAVLTEDDGCGEVEHRELVFAGESEVTLIPGESGTFEVDGVPLTATALRSFDYIGETTCTDVAGATVWTVWR